MGGPPTPAVGWAAGIERLAMLLGPATRAGGVAVVPVGGSAGRWRSTCSEAAPRRHPREMAYRGNLRRRMERANRIGARAAVIIGEDDIARRGTGEEPCDREREAVTRGDRRSSAMNLAPKLAARPRLTSYATC
jgi:histidyl-tRNA synthetase